MIARRWSARATRENAGRYARYFRETLTPHLRELAGYQGARLLEREADEGAIEIVVLTWWESMAAIRAFAGDDLTTAVISDEARPLLLDADARVAHYHVAFADDVPGLPAGD
jgi:heme-degrading monooxygenase HmoA